MAMVMWMVAAYWRTHTASRLAWSEGWRAPGAASGYYIIIIIISERSLYAIARPSACRLFVCNVRAPYSVG